MVLVHAGVVIVAVVIVAVVIVAVVIVAVDQEKYANFLSLHISYKTSYDD